MSAEDPITEEFGRSLDAARAWRKKEISELVQALSGTEDGSQLNETLRRALALLLNAHWEALVKFAVDSYLRAAKALGEAEGLPEGIAFCALAAEQEYKVADAREAKRLKGKLKDPSPVLHPLADVLLRVEYDAGKMWSELPDSIGSRVGLSLWWNRLEYLCGLIDIPVPRGIIEPNVVNERVVGARHQIAHGGDALPEQDALLDARDRVLRLVDDLVDGMQRSLTARRFAA